MTSLWQRLAGDPGEERLWVLEFMFTRAILPAGRGPRAGDVYSQARIVRERLRRWRGGEYLQLWQEAKELTKEKRRKPKKKRDEEQSAEEKQKRRNAERAKTLAQDGQHTKALQPRLVWPLPPEPTSPSWRGSTLKLLVLHLSRLRLPLPNSPSHRQRWRRWSRSSGEDQHLAHQGSALST